MSTKAKTIAAVIFTPEDRQRHIDACKERDAKSGWGLVLTPGYYEKLGDHASVNSWYYYDSSIGFNRLYANTPEWIVDLAKKMRWISDRGERALT